MLDNPINQDTISQTLTVVSSDKAIYSSNAVDNFSNVFIDASSYKNANALEDWINSDPLGWFELDSSIDLDLESAHLLDDNNNTNPISSHIEMIETPSSHTFIHTNNTNDAVDSSMVDKMPINSFDAHSFDVHSFDTYNLPDTVIPMTQPDTVNDTPSINTEVASAFDGDTSRANPNFKPLLPEPKHRNESGRQLIMDTETTGLDALKGDRIIEVGIVELVDRKFTGEKLHVYINPERGMDEEVIRIHGISEAFLADKPTFDKVAKPLYEFMLGAEVIAHNAAFDINFLTMEFDKVGMTDFADSIKITDSLAMAKQQYPGQKNTLDALVRRLNVGKVDRTFHGALLDSEILAEVYLAMTGGQVSLAIDDDNQSEGGVEHIQFADMAHLLLPAQQDTTAHIAWIAEQVSDYPQLIEHQAVSCMHRAENPSLHLPTIGKQTPSLSKMLFLDSEMAN